MDKYQLDFEKYEASQYCKDCGGDVYYSRTVANGECWFCKNCNMETLINHKPNEEDYAQYDEKFFDKSVLYPISDSFNKTQQEFKLLNNRIMYSKDRNEKLDEFGSEILEMKIRFDKLVKDFNKFSNKELGR